MYKIGKMPQAVDIGYVGETNFRKLEIDMKEWMRLMPEGVPSIVCIRPGETKADAYVAVTTFEDDVLTWRITAADIGTKEGEGEIQIWLEEEENGTVNKRGKSVKVKTRVNDAANDPSPDTPTSQEAFIEQVTELKTAAVNAKTAAEDAAEDAEDAKDAAEQAAADAEAAVVHQPYIDSTSKHWMVWDSEEGEYTDTEIRAEGQQGQPGDPTQLIDDTAGEGATGKTWSADKLDDTTGQLLNAIQGVKDDLTAYKKLDFELGTISIANGQIDKSYSNRVCCAEYIECDSILTVTPGNDTKVNLRFYDKNKSFLGGTSSWKTTKQTVADYKSTYPTAKYLRIACAYTDDSTISDPTVFVGKIEVKIKGNLSDLYEKVEKNTDGLSDKSFEYNNIGTLENPNSVTYRNTGYVPVNEGDVVEYRTRIRNGYTYYVFDENKTQILRGEFVALDTEHGFITIPSGGKYIFAQTMHTNHDYYEKYTPILKILGIKSLIEGSQNLKIHNKPTGNVSIVCAKEFTFNDGTPPVNEFYLLEEPLTQQFYITHDFSDKIKAFKFIGEDSYKYTFGILQNGDIIAVRLAETLTGTGKNDANRMNPFVFLASENWSIQHEVSFGSALKPCGWLSNTGFRVLPNGTTVFCEYTRVTTETSNVWVLSGDPLVASNWTVTKSFPITNPGDGTLFKHCHTIQYDHFTGVVYVATGDDDVGSMIWYSTDNGLTWTQLIPPNGSSQQDEHGWYMGSEKYCRLLMFTFTDDYIYWASDTPLPNRHFLFRAERNNNGVLDFDTVEDYVEIPAVSTLATYGTAYIPELNSIMLLERSDSGATSAPIRLVDLETDELVTVATMYSASGSSDNVGFRTRFSEWYPHNGFIRLGFMLRVSPSKAVNTIKGFGNTGATNDPGNNINNLTLKITKQDGNFKLVMGTIYI